MRKLGMLGTILTLGLGAGMFAAQQGKRRMPTVSAACVPLYPRAIRAARIQGDVVLALMIDKTGVTKNIRMLTSPDQALTDSAIAAVSQWRYRPYELNGSHIDVRSTVAVRFTLH